MLRNYKEIGNSRLHLKDSDYEFFMNQAGLTRNEVVQIFKIFDEKGGVLNKIQFKKAFSVLNQKWLKDYKNPEEISDFIFRSFDSDKDGALELSEFMTGCATMYLSKGEPKKKLEYLFDFYDRNRDGSLTLDEIKEGFHVLFSMLGSDTADNICKNMAETVMNDMGVDPLKKIKKGI